MNYPYRPDEQGCHNKLVENKAVLNFPMFGNYRVNIVVTNCIGCSSRKRRHSNENIMNTVAGACMKGDGISTIILEEGSNFGTVAHESLHAVNDLLEFCNLDRYEPELSSYLLGHITDKAFHLVIKSFEKSLPKKQKKESK